MIEELLGSGVREGSPLSELVRLSVEHIVEEALEAKVEELLGRGYHERGSAGGYRNGYRRGRLKTSEGSVDYAVPQVRDVDAGAIRALREQLRGRSDELERLAIEMYARGCSTRDIEAIFGPGMLSRTSVSELTEQLWEEYEAFATRDLSEIEPLYVFVDGLYERLRPGAKREAVLCAWCLTWAGKKVLLRLSPGLKESKDDCRDFLQDLQRRGLAEPVLVVTDGAAGLIAAVETCWPAALRQRIEATIERYGAGETKRALSERPASAGKLHGHVASRVRGQAREALRERVPVAIRSYATARQAEQTALRRLEPFRRNPKRPVLEAASQARAVLGRALRRLESLDRRYSPEKLLRTQAVSVVRRLGWRVVSRLIPGPALNALRVTLALTKAPTQIISRGMGRGIER